MIDTTLDWLASLPTPATYAVLMIMSALENVFPPVPADVAVALGAFLVARGEVTPVVLGILCWAANCASAFGMYLLGRVYGPDLFRKGWGRRLLPPEALAAVQYAYHRYGVWGIFWTRFLPGVRAAVMPFAGVVALPPERALIPAFLASALWYAGLIVVGSALGLQWEAIRSVVIGANRALGVVALIAAALFALWMARRMRRADR